MLLVAPFQELRAKDDMPRIDGPVNCKNAIQMIDFVLE